MVQILCSVLFLIYGCDVNIGEWTGANKHNPSPFSTSPFDRGSQYGSKEYIKLLKDNEIKVSMGMIAQDNAFAERVNGTIKNEYLKLWHIPDLKTLEKKTRQAVNHYNEKRLHQAFKNEYSPMEFKKSLLNLKTQERPMVIIYAEGNYKVKVASSHLDFNPREEPLAHNCPMIIN